MSYFNGIAKKVWQLKTMPKSNVTFYKTNPIDDTKPLIVYVRRVRRTY